MHNKDIDPEKNEENNLNDVKKEDEIDVGEFDDIFSDSSESDNESLGQSDDVVDFSEEFKHFTSEIKRRRSQNKEKGKDSSIESLIVGAVTYDRSYRFCKLSRHLALECNNRRSHRRSKK